jgi:hypothetical protein
VILKCSGYLCDVINSDVRRVCFFRRLRDKKSHLQFGANLQKLGAGNPGEAGRAPSGRMGKTEEDL